MSETASADFPAGEPLKMSDAAKLILGKLKEGWLLESYNEFNGRYYLTVIRQSEGAPVSVAHTDSWPFMLSVQVAKSKAQQLQEYLERYLEDHQYD